MRQDMNFFSAFTKKKSNDKTVYALIAVIAAVALFILISCSRYLIGTFINHREAQEYLGKLEKLDSQVTESNLVNTEIDGLTQYNTLLTDLNNVVESRSVVNTALLDNLGSTLPTDFNIGSLDIDNNTMKITASASNKITAAEFQHNLKSGGFERIKDVQINSITWNDAKNNWDVTATCTLKEDKKYEK